MAAEDATPKTHAFRYQRATLGQLRYMPMPLYILPKGGSSLLLRCILLSRGETRYMDLGTVSLGRWFHYITHKMMGSMPLFLSSHAFLTHLLNISYKGYVLPTEWYHRHEHSVRFSSVASNPMWIHFLLLVRLSRPVSPPFLIASISMLISKFYALQNAAKSSTTDPYAYADITPQWPETLKDGVSSGVVPDIPFLPSRIPVQPTVVSVLLDREYALVHTSARVRRARCHN